MFNQSRPQEGLRHHAARLIARLDELGVKWITWAIYWESDENNLVDVACTQQDGREEYGLEDETVLWEISELFAGETGVFEVDVARGQIKKLGDVWAPTELEYDYYEKPETIEVTVSERAA